MLFIAGLNLFFGGFNLMAAFQNWRDGDTKWVFISLFAAFLSTVVGTVGLATYNK